MIISLHKTYIAKGDTFTQGFNPMSLWKVVGWVTYKGLSEIELERIDSKGQKLENQNMKVLSCHWEESCFQPYLFQIGEIK